MNEKLIRKRPALFIICGVLFFFFSFFIRNIFVFDYSIKAVLFTLFFYVPPLVSVILLYVHLAYNENKTIKIQIILIFIYILYYIILSIISFITMLNCAVDNPKLYNKIKEYYTFTYFPNVIPSNSTNVILHQNFGLFQGADTFSLYFIANSNYINNEKKKYSNNKIVDNVKEDILDKHKNLIFYYTPYKDKDVSNFDIYKIDYNCDETIWCNHGVLKIIAINEEKKEIVYFYSNW